MVLSCYLIRSQSSISWNVKLDNFFRLLVEENQRTGQHVDLFLLRDLHALKVRTMEFHGNFYIHNRTNIKRWEKLWTFAMPSNLAKSSPVFQNSFATREKAAMKFLCGTSRISHIKCMLETFISSNVCMKFAHKKVFGEVRRWIVIFFENQFINACRHSSSDWSPGEAAEPKHPADSKQMICLI